jgi:DNA-binding PucR family transcriptional regulator
LEVAEAVLITIVPIPTAHQAVLEAAAVEIFLPLVAPVLLGKVIQEAVLEVALQVQAAAEVQAAQDSPVMVQAAQVMVE